MRLRADEPPPPTLAAPSETLRLYMRSALAENTWRTYESQWRGFVTWCDGRGSAALPATPETVADYLAERARAGAAVASIHVMLAALQFAHLAAGLALRIDDPTLALVLKGIRRSIYARNARPNL